MEKLQDYIPPAPSKNEICRDIATRFNEETNQNLSFYHSLRLANRLYSKFGLKTFDDVIEEMKKNENLLRSEGINENIIEYLDRKLLKKGVSSDFGEEKIPEKGPNDIPKYNEIGVTSRWCGLYVTTWSPEAFATALKQGNYTQVRALLESGMPVDYPFKSNGTALMLACSLGFREFVSLLLSYGADVNKKSDSGRTALMIASGRGYASLVSLLLSRGADTEIDHQMNDGTNSLMKACRGGHGEVVGVLIHRGANLNLKCNNGYTPLMYSVMAGNPLCLSLLLQAEALTDMKDKEGNTPLMLACTNRRVDLASLLLNFQADPNIQDRKGENALMKTILSTSHKKSSTSKSKGKGTKKTIGQDNPNVDELTEKKDKESGLFTLASPPSFSFASSLTITSSSSSPPLEPEDLSTALEAEMTPVSEILILLLDHQAKIDLQNLEGNSALMVAVMEGDEDASSVLLSRGANPNLKNKKGDTPLNLAALHNRQEICQLLLNKGGDTSLANRDGKSSTQIAEENGNWRVRELLENKK